MDPRSAAPDHSQPGFGMSHECLFVADGDGFLPTDWSVGPWSADALQGSAYGGLLTRLLERSEAATGMIVARLSFDLWRPVTRERLTSTVMVLREGRKARTAEASLVQAGKPVARCTALFLKMDPSARPSRAAGVAPTTKPENGRAIPTHVKGWSPFFTGVDTRVVEGSLTHKPSSFARFFQRIASFSSCERESIARIHETGQSSAMSYGQSVPNTTRSTPTVSMRKRRAGSV
jgi:Thioesterase-like superfamily